MTAWMILAACYLAGGIVWMYINANSTFGRAALGPWDDEPRWKRAAAWIFAGAVVVPFWIFPAAIYVGVALSDWLDS